MKTCKFIFEDQVYEEGVCTRFGACRFGGKDYMYQGGCGELSLWGAKSWQFDGTQKCRMLVKRKRVAKGKCLKNGHCWSGSFMKLLSPSCRKNSEEIETPTLNHV